MPATTPFRRNRPLPLSPRTGFTLIEMLVVVALSSLLLGVVLSLMMGLKQWDRLSRTSSTRNEQLLRLSTALRSDIRGGADVLVSIEGPLVVMNASGEQLRYEFGPEGCHRTVIAPGSANPPTHHSADLFAIGAAAKWIVERKPAGKNPLVTIKIEPPSEKRESTAPRMLPFLVYAALGTDAWERPVPAN
jgi:prepilin-type N-terminal cleavage/methylation domain-containing protein